MDAKNHQNHDKWAAKLSSESFEDQAEALRQISAEQEVTGLTVAVVAFCGSSDDEVRMWSAEALEVAIRPQVSEVPELIELIEQADDGEIYYWAATMLGRLGPEAATAVAALEQLLCDSMYLPARERATWALAEIGPAAAAAIPSLQSVAENAPPRLKRLAHQALAAINGDRGSDEIAA